MPGPRPTDLRSLARDLARLIRDGWLVALDEEGRVARLGTCKRSAKKLVHDLRPFERHVAGFLAAVPRLAGWKLEKVAIAPSLSRAERAAIGAAGFIAQDLHDLTRELAP